MAVDRLTTALEDLLTSAKAALEDDAIEAPSRQYRSHGEPAEDGCDQLVAWADRLSANQHQGPGNLPSNAPCSLIPTTDLAVRLSRCWGSMPRHNELVPGDDDLDYDADQLARDGWALFRGLTSRALDGTLFPTLGLTCQGIELVDADPTPPEGGIASWTVRFRVQLGA